MRNGYIGPLLLTAAMGLGMALGCSTSTGTSPADGGGDLAVQLGGGDDMAMHQGGGNDDMATRQDAGGPTGFPKIDVFEADACHDLDIAVGPTRVATATNSGHVVFYKKDGTQDHVHEFSASCGDQHIQWDDSSQRWFFSVMNCGQDVLVFASLDADGQNWTPTLTATLTGGLDDVQLSVTTDKVLLVNADCVFPIDKQVLLAGKTSALSPTGTCGLMNQEQVWAVHSGHPEPSTAYYCTMSDDGHLNWISVDGTGTNIAIHQHPTAISGFTTFPVGPGIPQPGGTQLRASGVLGAWHNNELWCSFVEQCGSLSCQRMFHVRTDTTSETDFDFSVPNVYVWSAAPGIDKNGNMWSLMSESSTSLNPSLAVGGYSAGGVKTEPQIVYKGTMPDVTAQTFGDWGDFFACDQDPTDGSVWCLGNYGGAPVHNCPTPAKIVHITPQ
jgi:hypothetical protein